MVKVVGSGGKREDVARNQENAVSRCAVLLEGEKSTMFGLEQHVVQGCSLSPIR